MEVSLVKPFRLYGDVLYNKLEPVDLYQKGLNLSDILHVKWLNNTFLWINYELFLQMFILQVVQILHWERNLRILHIHDEEGIVLHLLHGIKGVYQVLSYLWNISNIQIKCQSLIKLRVLFVINVHLQKGSGQTSSQVHMRRSHNINLKRYQYDKRHVDGWSEREPVVIRICLDVTFVLVLRLEWIVFNIARRSRALWVGVRHLFTYLLSYNKSILILLSNYKIALKFQSIFNNKSKHQFKSYFIYSNHILLNF